MNDIVYHVFSHDGRSLYFGTPQGLANYLNTMSAGATLFIETITEKEFRARIFLQIYTSYDIMVPGL
jgi:hypothetical protein